MTTTRTLTAALVLACAAFPAGATFHLVQIEQVIGGVNGDTSIQAIQLRLRSAFECFFSPMQLWVRDATGSNPVLLFDFAVCPEFPETCIAACGDGDRALLTSPGFNDGANPPITADFTLLNAIPASYLAAGTLTYETSTGDVFWRLSWGGAAYTGPNDGLPDNDLDGDFGPPWPGALPSSGVQALQFQGEAAADSTTNAADYALTAGAAVFTNNAGATAVIRPLCPGDCEDGDGTVGIVDFLALLSQWGATGSCDIDGGGVGITDFLALLGQWGDCP